MTDCTLYSEILVSLEEIKRRMRRLEQKITETKITIGGVEHDILDIFRRLNEIEKKLGGEEDADVLRESGIII